MHAAITDSIERLTAASIIPIGAGHTYQEANAVRVVECNGMRFGWYAYTNLLPASLNAGADSAGLSEFDERKIAERIKNDKAEKNLDRIIVSIHWGEEYEIESNTPQKRIAHELADAGTDIIVGHHPHVAQETELYNGSLILYSLGNFVFDQGFSPETMRGLVARVTVSSDGIEPEYFTSYLNKQYQVERIEKEVQGER